MYTGAVHQQLAVSDHTTTVCLCPSFFFLSVTRRCILSVHSHNIGSNGLFSSDPVLAGCTTGFLPALVLEKTSGDNYSTAVIQARCLYWQPTDSLKALNDYLSTRGGP